MSTISFNYSDGKGKKVEPNTSLNHFQQYKNKWTNYIDKRYGENLISPTVYIFLTNDGTEIINAVLIATGV